MIELDAQSETSEQRLFWGMATAVALLGLGLLLFVALKLLPMAQQQAALSRQIADTAAQLAATEQMQANVPTRLQQQIDNAQSRLDETARRFLSESQATSALDRLYSYSRAAGVEIIDLQVQPGSITDTLTVKVFSLRAQGELAPLFDFLGSIEETARPGFVVSDLLIAAEPPTPAPAPKDSVEEEAAGSPEIAQDEPTLLYTLSAKLTLYISPYAPEAALDETANAASTDSRLAQAGAGPLAALQERLQAAWQANDWALAVEIAEQMALAAPEQPEIVEARYRAYVNAGYHLLAARRVEEARAHFEMAATVKPTGQEALLELQQLASGVMPIFAAEEQLHHGLEAAIAAGQWIEAIRLLRLIQTINPNYPGLQEQLRQAYTAYGDQLTRQGQPDLAQEQYQQAQLLAAPVAPIQ